MEYREMIARRVAKELKDGDVVNLGIGMPTLVANYLPKNINIVLHSENGLLGLGPKPLPHEEDKDLVNAGGQAVSIALNGSCFDSALSFAIIRGGHIDKTILGGLEVDEKGNLANWIIPNKMIPGMGGAMDLVVGSKKVIVAMEHINKNGRPKILKRCTLPLTAAKEVDMIVTNMAVIEVTDGGLVLKEIAPGLSVKEVLNATEADLALSGDLKTMDLD